MIARIKKNDTVVLIAGKEKGQQGPVIEVWPKKDKVLVKGLGVVKRHTKARKRGEVAGIKSIESFFPLCKVMLICGSCKKACRVQAKKLDDGTHVRICHRCKEIV